MAPVVSTIANRGYVYAVGLFLAIAILLGGGGAAAPLHDLIIQLLAVVILIPTLLSGTVFMPATRGPIILLLLIAATPLLQLVPMPHSLWSAFPGHALAASIDAQLGAGERWRPLSLDPEATLLTMFALLAPAAIFLAALRMGEKDQLKLIVIVICCAVLSAALGFLQMANISANFSLYGGTHNISPTGLFANRNHQADFLMIGMICAAFYIVRVEKMDLLRRWMLAIAVIAALSAAVIATTSRMGLILLPLAVFASCAGLPWKMARHRPFLLALSGSAIVVLATFMLLSDGMQRTVQRFDALSDIRFDYWVDTLFAARQYFPFGSGLGTFDPVFRSVESLARVGPYYVNLAHNDYLQIFMATGLWGCTLILAFLVLFARTWFRKTGYSPAFFRRPASFALAILLLHSVVDYPLRTFALLTVFGLLCALLFPSPSKSTMHSLPAGEGALV